MSEMKAITVFGALGGVVAAVAAVLIALLVEATLGPQPPAIYLLLGGTFGLLGTSVGTVYGLDHAGRADLDIRRDTREDVVVRGQGASRGRIEMAVHKIDVRPSAWAYSQDWVADCSCGWYATREGEGPVAVAASAHEARVESRGQKVVRK